MKKSRAKGILARIGAIIIMVVFFYSIYNLWYIHATYRDIEAHSEEIREEFVQPARPRPPVPVPEPDAEEYVDELYFLRNRDFLLVDFEGLQARNSDVIGWIYVPGTSINYPILAGRYNDEYLNLDLDRRWSLAGSIFLEENNSPTFTDLNTIIYGHNMLNGVKFSDIDAFVRGQIAPEAISYVYIYLPNGNVKVYKVVSAIETDRYSELYHLPVVDLQGFYDRMLVGSIIDVPFDRTNLPPVLMLSTCGDGFQTPVRKIIFAVLLGEIPVQ